MDININTIARAAEKLETVATRQSEQDARIADVAANLQAAEQRLAMLDNARSCIPATHRNNGIGASLIQRIDAGEADGFAALSTAGDQHSRRADA